MSNAFCHMQLNTTAVGDAKEFYGELFDWKLQDVPMGPATYTIIDTGDGAGGGIKGNEAPNTPSHWVVYVQVDDAAKATAKAKKLGGTVIVDATPVPNMGTFSIVSDPTGAVFGLWENG